EVRVAGRAADPLERRGSERGAAEVRVQDDARRVDDAPQPRLGTRVRRGDDTVDDVARVVARPELLARQRPGLAHRGERALARKAWELRRAEQPVDGRQLAALHA